MYMYPMPYIQGTDTLSLFGDVTRRLPPIHSLEVLTLDGKIGQKSWMIGTWILCTGPFYGKLCSDGLERQRSEGT